MKKALFCAVAVAMVCALLPGFTASQAKKAEPAKAAAPPKHEFTPGEIQWGAPPPFMPPGAQIAVVEGNPMAESGTYTIFAKMPAGYKIAPHWHPKRENVTVISGTFKLGMGDKWDDGKMKSYPAGGFAYLDPDMHHYAMAGTECTITVHGVAPLQFNYINPKDDPSKAAPAKGKSK